MVRANWASCIVTDLPTFVCNSWHTLVCHIHGRWVGLEQTDRDGIEDEMSDRYMCRCCMGEEITDGGASSLSLFII